MKKKHLLINLINDVELKVTAACSDFIFIVSFTRSLVFVVNVDLRQDFSMMGKTQLQRKCLFLLLTDHEMVTYYIMRELNHSYIMNTLMEMYLSCYY